VEETISLDEIAFQADSEKFAVNIDEPVDPFVKSGVCCSILKGNLF
jgi:hypothetical protein